MPSRESGLAAWDRLDVSLWTMIFRFATLVRYQTTSFAALHPPPASRPSAFLKLLLVCRAWKDVAEPLIYTLMHIEHRHLQSLVEHLHTQNPLLVHPTHRTTTLVLGNSSATLDARTRYDLSSLFILMPNLRALYAPSVLLRAHELVGLTYPSHLSLTSLTVGIDGDKRDCLLATSGLGRLRNLRKLEIAVGSGSDDWTNAGRDIFQNLAGVRLDGLEHLRFISRGGEKALVLSWISRWQFPSLRTFGIRMNTMLVTDMNLPVMATAVEAFMDAHRSITDLFLSAPKELTALVLRMDTSASTVHLSDPLQFLPALASSTRTLVCTGKIENTPVMDFLDLLLSPGAGERLRALQCLKLCVWHIHMDADILRTCTRRFAWKDMAHASRGHEFFGFLRYAERLQEHGVELLDDDGFGPPLITFPQSTHSQSVMITTT